MFIIKNGIELSIRHIQRRTIVFARTNIASSAWKNFIVRQRPLVVSSLKNQCKEKLKFYGSKVLL